MTSNTGEGILGSLLLSNARAATAASKPSTVSIILVIAPRMDVVLGFINPARNLGTQE